MAKITSEIRASQWSVKAEDLIKNSTLAELKDFILNNSEVEEDPDEESFVHVGKKNLWGKTYLITAEGFHHDEFFITNEGRIFYLISLNHQVEIIDEEAPEGMKLVKVDRNGSRHYEGQVECPKCSGVGLIAHHVENGVPSWNWTDGGVCWKCLGSGKVFGKKIIRTPEYQKKLDERRRKKAEEKKAEHDTKIQQIRKDWLTKNGFTEDGFTFLFLGDTYSKKDQIKELGGRFNRIVGWYIDHQVEGFDFLKISKDQILNEVYWGYDWKYDVDVKALKKAEEARLRPADHTSEYQGQIKERLRDLHLTVTFTTIFEGMQEKQSWNGRSYFKEDNRWFYSFKDEDGNIFTWTASLPAGIEILNDENVQVGFRSLKKGDTCILTGTVKKHKEYKGDKQTVLTRCKVQGIA